METKALYQGTIFGGLVDCYVLADKRRVISMRGAVRALANSENTEKMSGPGNAHFGRYLDRLPNDYRHLQAGPAVDFSRPDGRLAKGVTAERFYEVLVAYSEAHERGLLHPSQVHLAANCNRLLRAIGRVGIVSLVDEATGYQVEREANELQGLVAHYLRETPAQWQRLWSEEVVGRLCALYRIERKSKRFPLFACQEIGRIYRKILPAEVVSEIKRRNGKGVERIGNHHQFFKDSLWRFVHNDIPFIAYIARISRNKREFWNHMDARYSGGEFQTSLGIQ